jgi:hypothetical protein
VKQSKKAQKKASMDSLTELGRRYGVKVTDMSGRGVRAIGILGGVGRSDQRTPNLAAGKHPD